VRAGARIVGPGGAAPPHLREFGRNALDRPSIFVVRCEIICGSEPHRLSKKLLGENEVEAVLQRLDRLTQDEARTAAAQTLDVVYGLVQNMNVVIEGAAQSQV